MPKKGTLTVNDARDIIDIEGVGYGVQYHTQYTQFADEKLRELWKNATDALNTLVKFIDDNATDEDDDEDFDDEFDDDKRIL